MLLRDEYMASIHVGCTICPGYHYNNIVGLKDLNFKTKDEFYNYIKQFKGITVPSKESPR